MQLYAHCYYLHTAMNAIICTLYYLHTAMNEIICKLQLSAHLNECNYLHIAIIGTFLAV